MATIISTLTNNFTFVKYSIPPDKSQLPVALRRIRIFGGANRPSMKGFGDMTSDNQGVPIWTAAGVSTQVSDEDMKWLGEDPTFKQFVEGGNLKVLDKQVGNDHDKIKRIVSDMSPSDSHAPLRKGDARTRASKIQLVTNYDNE